MRVNVNVTDATCEYGLARTELDCVTTLAALCGKAYSAAQLVYCVAGFVALAASAYKLACAVRFRGAMLQKQIFCLCAYAALTITLRGVDPSSYAHFLPRSLTTFLADSCTATLHTILIKTLGFYVSITQHGASRKRQSLVVCEWLAIALIWSFFLACDAFANDAKGFSTGVRGPVVLFVSAGYLFLLSTSFVLYGFQVIKRLDAIEHMQLQQLALDSLAATSRTVDFSSSCTSNSAVLEEKLSQPSRSAAARIRHVIVVTETVALLCIGVLVYMGVERARAGPALELACANGVDCDHIRVRIDAMHVFQYVWIWVALWAYWRTQQRDSAIVGTTAEPKRLHEYKTPAAAGPDHV